MARTRQTCHVGARGSIITSAIAIITNVCRSRVGEYYHLASKEGYVSGWSGQMNRQLKTIMVTKRASPLAASTSGVIITSWGNFFAAGGGVAVFFRGR